jgi:hypothetical protein
MFTVELYARIRRAEMEIANVLDRQIALNCSEAPFWQSLFRGSSRLRVTVMANQITEFPALPPKSKTSHPALSNP